MDIYLKSRQYPEATMLIADFSIDSSEELLNAIEQAKKEIVWLNFTGYTIEYEPAKLILTKD